MGARWRDLLRSTPPQVEKAVEELKKGEESSRKNFRIAPYFIMHAHRINYAFYSLFWNKIDNSLGNWTYTSLIITYWINKRGFFSQRFFPRCFPLSLSILPSFSSPFLWRALPPIYPSFKAPLNFFSFFLRYLHGSNSIVFVRLAGYSLYHCSTCACCR